MKVAVFGLGYVGLTAAACLTSEGHTVLGVDVNAEKVRQINAGHSPIAEAGLEELLQKALAENRLNCTTDASRDLNSCDLAMVCVGTPSSADGSHNMAYIAEVSRQIAQSVRPGRAEPLTVVYRSTIRPGTVDQLICPIFASVLQSDIDVVELVYNPEFMREAVAIKDYFAPPKVVIGTKDGKPSRLMDVLNANISARVFYTGYREAEITKFVDNSFHAVKIAFANEIGRVCINSGINAKTVHEIFVSDTKLNISPYYLRPGGAFGGSCLPKDVRALQYISSDVGAGTHLVDSLIRSNEAHKHFLFRHCTRDLPVEGRILMLGLAFKQNSDDLRESPNVDLARKFLTSGHRLSVFDPSLIPAKLIGQNLGYAYANLPQLSELLIEQDRVVEDDFDVIVDTNGSAARLGLRGLNVIDINAL